MGDNTETEHIALAVIGFLLVGGVVDDLVRHVAHRATTLEPFLVSFSRV